MQDETGQKKGISDVAYCPGDLFSICPPSKVSHFFSKVGDVIVNLPMRITSYHFCYNDPRMKLVLESIRTFSGKHLRLRVRTHYGSDLEMEYSLITFGIPCKTLLQSDLVYDDGSDMKQHLHQRFLERRRQTEQEEYETRKQEEKDTGIIYYPQPNDVLVGRGRPYQDYSGNQRWIRIIEDHLEMYHKHIDRFAKTCLSMDIVKQVQDYGGRFIERTKSGGAWCEIDDVMAREKTVVAFRSRVNKVDGMGVNKPKKQKKHLQESSSTVRKNNQLSPQTSEVNNNKRLRYDTSANNVATFPLLKTYDIA